MAKYVSPKIKLQIVAKQNYKCNNKPGRTLRNLTGFDCPVWKRKDNPGTFDEYGYEIDHIMEFSLTKNNSMENLQALCKKCHAEKTRQYMTGNERPSKNKSRKSNIVKNIKILKVVKSTKSARSEITENNDLIEDNDLIENNELFDECELIETIELCDVNELEFKKETKQKKYANSTLFICRKCRKNFSSKASLEYHRAKKVCSKGTRYECKYCSRNFAHQSSLSRHYKKCDKLNGEVSDDEESDNESDDSIKLSKKEIMGKFAEMQIQIDGLRKENCDLKVAKNKVAKNKVAKNKVTINDSIVFSGDKNNVNSGVINNNIYFMGCDNTNMDHNDRNEIVKAFNA